MSRLKVALLTREYPPDVYGGAGGHVEYLARALSGLVDLTVHCQGGPEREGAVVVHHPWGALKDPVLRFFSADLSMADAVAGADVLHSHTWYANLAGHLASLLYGVPHVMTVHSLEPLRPWKAEQLGGGYALSSWSERVAATSAAAVVAVSEGMRADVLSAYPEISPERTRVIRNGIDTSEYAPDPDTGVLVSYGVDPERPYVIFVGRITRQKGVAVLLRAAAMLDPAAQLVLCAGAADTPELREEVTSLVAGLQASRTGVVWIPEMLPKHEVIQLLSHATVFACPSVYEPLGIVNLEAMACATAVVGSRVGGIPEVVDDGVTGLLVPPGDPVPLSDALNALLRDPVRAARMGEAGRERAVDEFSWDAVAAQTAELYAELLLQNPDSEEAFVVAGVGAGARQDPGSVAVHVRDDGDGGRGELGEGVADRCGPSLDQAVGVEQQHVAGAQLQVDLLVLGGPVHAEQHPLGHRLRSGDAAAHQDRRQVPRPPPAQHLGFRVVPAADHCSPDTLGEQAGREVQLAEQLVRLRAGGGESTQRVARGDHGGDRLDAVTFDIADHEQQVATGQRERVVPVSGDQVAGLGRPVPHRDVHPGGLPRVRTRRHDRALQPDGELVLLRGPLLAVGQLIAGRGQRDLGLIERRDVLEGAAQRHHVAVLEHRLGEDPDLPDGPVLGPDDAEKRGCGFVLPQQRLAEPAQQRAVRGDNVVVHVGHADRSRIRVAEAEDGERRLGPPDCARLKVLIPAAELAEPLYVAE